MTKKIFLTSILAITFAMPAMAQVGGGVTTDEPTVTVQPGVGGSTTCDTTTLGQSENNSTANVEAIWVPNTYDVRYRCGSSGLWFRAEKCITLDGCEVVNPVYGQTYKFNSGIACSRTGYAFLNWLCTDSAENTMIYNAGQSITYNIDSDLSCMAQYTANTINIDWFSDGSRVAQNSCTYDSTITLPETPTKTGYTFNGWVLSNPCADLTTQSACNTNTSCFWHVDAGECINTNRNINGCAQISDREECNAIEHCRWGFYEDLGKVCQTSAPVMCGYMANESDCVARGCQWYENECVDPNTYIKD